MAGFKPDILKSKGRTSDGSTNALELYDAAGNLVYFINTDSHSSPRYKDSFGFLRTALTGATTWTDRAIRNTGVVVPHIAKNDTFTYNVQLNHDRKFGVDVTDFHLHIVPIGAVTAGQVISIDYEIEIFGFHDTIGDTLLTKSNSTYTLAAGDQYKHLYFEIKEDILKETTPGVSSFLMVKLSRRNDATDTYAGEFALLGADCHYITDRDGSIFETYDA